MSNQIAGEKFSKTLLIFLRETFEKVEGIYLDQKTSLQETLANLSAAEASRPIAGGTTIASQVEHLLFYIDVTRKYMDGQKTENINWPQSWVRKTVNESEWDILRARLVEDYRKLTAYIEGISNWDNEELYEGALAILVHTAYHLGAMRQIVHIARVGEHKQIIPT